MLSIFEVSRMLKFLVCLLWIINPTHVDGRKKNEKEFAGYDLPRMYRSP